MESNETSPNNDMPTKKELEETLGKGTAREDEFTKTFYWGYVIVSIIAFIGTLTLLYDGQLLGGFLVALICIGFIYLSIKQPPKKNMGEITESQKFN